MLYHVETEERTAGGKTDRVFTLRRDDIGSLIEVWPAKGFNCLRWRVDGHELLYAAPDWHTNPVPTRSGIPILFPFPNRIRDGQFVYQGKSYNLPKNDPSRSNAIHGFAPRNPWRVIGHGSDAHAAWIQADFQIARDVPDAGDCWPGDGILSVVYRLKTDRLRIEMKVSNAGKQPFPFGVGLHPYFRLPGEPHDLSLYQIEMPARSIWPLADSLPIGKNCPAPDGLNWTLPRSLGSGEFDTLYGDLGSIRSDTNGMLMRAGLSRLDQPGKLEIWTTADFREAVLFTPPHRNAVCVEPYTCVTDAVNLQAAGVDAGWRELMPSEDWDGVVEFRWNAAE